MNTLVIVESPNKEKTIKKYLGDNYEVMSSVGHVVKLKTSGKMGLGIDLENWEPDYAIDKTKKEVMKKLKKAVDKVDQVLIATDPDREGEAIGENLVSFLKIENKYKRIKYNEITKEAILRAIEKPMQIDEDLVKAQKSRRMLDRIIGFRLTKLIESKISNSPGTVSAGRVQSIALKLVVDKEKEIDAFVPMDYFTVGAIIGKGLEAQYYNPEAGPEFGWVSPDKIEQLMNDLKGDLVVNSVKKSRRLEARITPFKQSALYKRAGLAASTVQSAMQKLYEGYGNGGLISYPRTDSTRLSETFINQAKQYLNKKFGPEYVSTLIKGIAGDQDAHEAIRPTDVTLTPSLAAQEYPLSDIELRIYTLIYNNTLQAIMEPPVRNIVRYELMNNNHQFRISNSKITFDGYYALIGKPEADVELPNYQEGDIVAIEKYNSLKHTTKPPARFNDGSLIEMLDNIKVGRPSTFSSTVKIIKDRQYVELEGKAIKPTEFGKIVLEMLLKNFPTIINEEYTAKVEGQLDQIADGKINYKDVMQDFWINFDNLITQSIDNIEKKVFKLEETGESCPEEGSALVYRFNKKNGQRFIACSAFPKCRFIKPDPDAKPVFSRRRYQKKA